MESMCKWQLREHGSQCDGMQALFGRFQLPDGPHRCAIFLFKEKVIQGTSRSADSRAFRRIAPKSLELVLVSKPVAFAFCGRLLVQQPAECCFPCCLPSFVVVLVFVLSASCPAGGLVCALVQLAPRCAGASLIPGIHYFDAHRLQPLLLRAPALQVHMRESPLVGPERASETVDDPSSEEERATTESESEVDKEADEEETPPEEPWCPPIPPAVDDPTEMEIKGAADKLATMMHCSQPQANMFFEPDNLGALPHLWL